MLDYVFLKLLAEKFCAKKYLEIGTYIGESINMLTDCCEELYSITAIPGSQFSMREWCKKNGIPDYSNRLIYNNKIKQYLVKDSKNFDFSILPDDIDLFFIDGDHSYSGIYNDTRNIFSIKKEQAIVVWHDLKTAYGYRPETVRAIKDAVGDDFRYVYATNNNLCGIYLPQEIKNEIYLKKNEYAEQEPLYTYDLNITAGRI